MLDTAEALSAWIKPSREGDELRRFVNEGRQLAEWLHVSGPLDGAVVTRYFLASGCGVPSVWPVISTRLTPSAPSTDEELCPRIERVMYVLVA
jgi:hypothetical protein